MSAHRARPPDAGGHRDLRALLGVYVLGAATESERAAVRAHLEGCADCRTEIAELRPVVAALDGVDPDHVADPSAPPAPPAELGDRIAAAVRAGNRDRARTRRLRQGGAGLLAAAALVGAFVLGGRLQQPPAAPPVIAMAVEQVAPGVQADAGLVRHTWGTELVLTASGLTEGGSYTVAFVRPDGSVVSGGTFLGTGSTPLRCSLNAAVPLDDTAEIVVTDAAGTVVVDAVAV